MRRSMLSWSRWASFFCREPIPFQSVGTGASSLLRGYSLEGCRSRARAGAESSLGSPAARRTLERVPAERAETVRQITRLRNAIAHSASTHEAMTAIIELIDLLRSLGFSWREEIPEEMLLFALNRASASLAEEATRQDLAEAAVHTDRLARDARAAAAKVQRPSQQAGRPSPQPDREVRRASHKERPLNEVKFLTVAGVASLMEVSKMTVYGLVHSGDLPAIRVGRSFRVPEQAVRDYLSEKEANRHTAG
jgi:excisionase family DNA binding protein